MMHRFAVTETMMWVVDNNLNSDGTFEPVFLLVWSEERDGSLKSFQFASEWTARLADNIANGEHVPAIKFIRDITYLGLKEAKAAYDTLRTRLTVNTHKPERVAVTSYYVEA